MLQKQKKTFNWKPEINLNEGISNFLKWYRMFYGKKIKLNFSNISELLIISLPVCLLFSNIISEIVVFALILICFKSFDKNILKKNLMI